MNLFLKLMPKKMILSLLVNLAKAAVKYTDNTIDDKLVSAIETALNNKDYGLQRKPTGPRKKVAKKA